MRTTTLLCLVTYLLPATACLTEHELHHLHGSSRSRRRPLYRRQGGPIANTTSTIPVAVGDRFKDGTTAPRGIGTHQPPIFIETHIPTNISSTRPGNAAFTTIYNVVELASGTRGLAREFDLPYFETPHKTHENRTMFGLKVPGAHRHGSAGYAVLLQAGIHARERGGPDHLLNFIADLLWARREGTGLHYGGSRFTAEEVRTALSVGIVVLPLVNPDGVAFDHATDSCWRKNRNPASASLNDTLSVGVDLNRNFATAWDFRTALEAHIEVASSVSPESEVFVGTAPLSEPETKNMDWTMGQMPDLRWFVDIHSVAGLLLYGWGHDTVQATDPSMNVLNPAYDGERGVFPETSSEHRYSEYYDRGGLDEVAVATTDMVHAMAAVRGRPWTRQQSIELYPHTGNSANQPLYRTITSGRNATGKKTKWAHGLTIEFGAPNYHVDCPFYPTVGDNQANMAEVGAALMALLLTAARLK